MSKITVKGVSPRYRPLWNFAEKLGASVTPYGPGTTVEVLIDSTFAKAFADEASKLTDWIQVRKVA
jgi:hypothetical protein